MKTQYVGQPIAKDTLNRKLTGVCAGIARHYKQPTWAVRLATLGLGLFFPSAVILAYLVATFLMPSRVW
jgi:phage shock protein PspC (stress-responsive transcriptional regulator)